MTTINDLELRIGSAEDIIVVLKDELAELKTHLQELKEKQDKQPEPESLFGRWATAPNGQRVLIVEHEWDEDGLIAVVGPTHAGSRETEKIVVSRDQVTVDPVTLTTIEEFKSAPIGTIIECTNGDAFAKDKEGLWNDEFNDKNMNNYYAPARVIRWGDGK